MVDEVLADARQVHDGRDAQGLGQPGGGDAGAHQDDRGADRARAEDDVAGADRRQLAVREQLDADRAVALEEDPGDLGAGADLQVGQVPGGGEVGGGGVHPLAVHGVAGDDADAGLPAAVEVVQLGQAERDALVPERRVDLVQSFARDPADGHRAAVAVEFGGHARVGLDLPVVREDVLPGPLGVAEADPLREVAGQAAQGDGAVDGRAAAHDLAQLVGEAAPQPAGSSRGGLGDPGAPLGAGGHQVLQAAAAARRLAR
ncbi:hypothetical protein GCM10020221_26270 [Streptomyces thioluteus]|uniref:Uncharacterized protein n=1 Tax=Streptomyces thioluteus TaxID=66431 RepID=A0ABN3WVB6_STRTU